MRVLIVYTRVVISAREQQLAASHYDDGADRFFSTYVQYRPAEEHELIICECGGRGPLIVYGSNLTPKTIEYYGHGWDCGAYQFAANALDCDLMVCCNSWAHFWRADWLTSLISAREKHGPGIYGISASFERGPHLRTPAIAFDPAVLRMYPYAVMNRDACNEFEAGPKSLTSWAIDKRIPALLVLPTGLVLGAQDWRKPRGIFRRDDQQNVLIYDRHTDAYAKETPEGKRLLERYADTV